MINARFSLPNLNAINHTTAKPTPQNTNQKIGSLNSRPTRQISFSNRTPEQEKCMRAGNRRFADTSSPPKMRISFSLPFNLNKLNNNSPSDVKKPAAFKTPILSSSGPRVAIFKPINSQPSSVPSAVKTNQWVSTNLDKTRVKANTISLGGSNSKNNSLTPEEKEMVKQLTADAKRLGSIYQELDEVKTSQRNYLDHHTKDKDFVSKCEDYSNTVASKMKELFSCEKSLDKIDTLQNLIKNQGSHDQPDSVNTLNQLQKVKESKIDRANNNVFNEYFRNEKLANTNFNHMLDLYSNLKEYHKSTIKGKEGDKYQIQNQQLEKLEKITIELKNFTASHQNYLTQLEAISHLPHEKQTEALANKFNENATMITQHFTQLNSQIASLKDIDLSSLLKKGLKNKKMKFDSGLNLNIKNLNNNSISSFDILVTQRTVQYKSQLERLQPKTEEAKKALDLALENATAMGITVNKAS